MGSFFYNNKDNENYTPHRKNYLLAIGVNNYVHFPQLYNPKDDIKELVKILTQKYCFEPPLVTELIDEEASREGIINTLDKIAKEISPKDNLLIYFAGHGYFRKEMKLGYLIPVDARPSIFADLLPNSTIYDYISGINSHHTFLILDSCFSGTMFDNYRSITMREVQIFAEKVDRIPSRWGLAAGLVERVADGKMFEHSPFAKVLLEYLTTNTLPRFPVSELIQHVSKNTTSHADQTPIGGVLAKTKQLGGQFVFHLKKNLLDEEESYWKETCKIDTMNSYAEYLDKFENGNYIPHALAKIKSFEEKKAWEEALIRNEVHIFYTFIKNYPDSNNCDKARNLIKLKLHPSISSTELSEKLILPQLEFPYSDMMLVAGGIFYMGSNESERETPVHKVTIENFWLGKTPVTFAEYDAFCDDTNYYRPSDNGWGRGSRPVINVSWDDAKAYCKWLSKKTGFQFRLPTEAEWEYAAGGGEFTRNIWSGTNEMNKLIDYAWYSVNSDNITHPVETKMPNTLGLYDMSGNILEWVEDHWHANYEGAPADGSAWINLNGDSERIYRGGQFHKDAFSCRVSFRYSYERTLRIYDLGFRIACSPEKVPSDGSKINESFR